jgi:protoheme IX farnesyltransferase
VKWVSSPRTARADGKPQGPIALIKPRVLWLLVLSGLAAAVVAEGREVDPVLLLLLLCGGLLSVSGANILNNVLDRDRDSLMERTMWRPLPAGTVGPGAASAIGVAVGAAGIGLLWMAFNALTAMLSLLGSLFYILVYTHLLKPRTPQNIVIGGFAGMVPPLVGWAAVEGSLSWQPAMIGLLIVLWTPPHFWSLALLHRDDYARAGLPMLPVVGGERVTRDRIVAYSVLMVAASIVPALGGTVRPVYLACALGLGAPVLALSLMLYARGTERLARALFKASSAYLALLLMAMVLDSLVGGAWG